MSSSLRDFYVGICHCTPQELERSTEYLMQLTSSSAIEIDSYIQGINNEFNHTRELAEIIEKYKMAPDCDKFPSSVYSFPYTALFDALEKDSNKCLKTPSEFALETNLLSAELSRVPQLRKETLENLREFICQLSMRIIAEHHNRRSYRRGLVA